MITTRCPDFLYVIATLLGSWFYQRSRYPEGIGVNPPFNDIRNVLYTEGTGVNPPFNDIRNVISNGYTGTQIDVNNAEVEGGIYGTYAIHQSPLRLHTLANSNVPQNHFNHWSRWYQTDGATQIFRLFPGEENVRNDRQFAARIEAFDTVTAWNVADGVWHDWVGRFTIVKPIDAAIFQVKDTDADEWAVHLKMSPDGRVFVKHRRPILGQNKTETLLDHAVGRPFDIRVRDNGLDYEVYLGNQSQPFTSGRYIRNDESDDNSTTRFRWGMYAEDNEITSEGLIFVSHASVDPSMLIVGWDTWTSGGENASWASGGATGFAIERSGAWGEASEAASTDGTFGSIEGASTVASSANTGTHIGSTTGSGSYDFTVTAGVSGLALRKFSFDARRKRDGSPFQWSATTISGAISNGATLGSGTLGSALLASGPSDHDDFDLDLTRLADNVLGPGEAATFRLSFSGGIVNNGEDQKTYLDNVAIFGYFW